MENVYETGTMKAQLEEVKQIEVVAAIIHDDEGRIFATQRGYGEMKDGWEFPGGENRAWGVNRRGPEA